MNFRTRIFILVLSFFSLFTFNTHAWDISATHLKDHVETLAQPAWEGRLPNSPGGKKARAWLKDKFISMGYIVVEQPIKGTFSKEIGANLIISLGEDPNTAADQSCVMIGAHYDHLGKIKNGGYYPGADDNASAVAVLLEIANALIPVKKKLGCFMLAAWDFEEGSIKTGGGLKGSKYFAAHPLFPLRKIGLSITFDLLGGSIAPGLDNKLFVFGSEHSSNLRARIASLSSKDQLEIEPVSTSIIEPFGSKVPRSDYGPFRDAQIPYLFFSTGTSHHYHRTSDTPEKINYVKLANIADSVLQLVWPFISKTEKLETLQHIAPSSSEIKKQDLTLTLSLLDAMTQYLTNNHAPQKDLKKLSVIRTHLSHYQQPEQVKTCELQSSFFRILETNHVKAPIPPRLIRFLLFCPI